MNWQFIANDVFFGLAMNVRFIALRVPFITWATESTFHRPRNVCQN